MDFFNLEIQKLMDFIFGVFFHFLPLKISGTFLVHKNPKDKSAL